MWLDITIRPEEAPYVQELPDGSIEIDFEEGARDPAPCPGRTTGDPRRRVPDPRRPRGALRRWAGAR